MRVEVYEHDNKRAYKGWLIFEICMFLASVVLCVIYFNIEQFFRYQKQTAVGVVVFFFISFIFFIYSVLRKPILYVVLTQAGIELYNREIPMLIKWCAIKQIEHKIEFSGIIYMPVRQYVRVTLYAVNKKGKNRKIDLAPKTSKIKVGQLNDMMQYLYSTNREY